MADFNKVKLDFNEDDFRHPRSAQQTDENTKKTGLPLKFWLKQKRIVINLVVMAFVWLTCSFNFYLIAFLLTSFEQVYLTTLFSCISDMTAYASGGIIFGYLGVKKTQILGFSISTLGGLLILFIGLNNQESLLFPVLVMFAKIGVALSFGLNYVSNAYLFPTLFAATAIGLCNTFARAFSALSPIFAQMDEPLPMILFTVSSAVTLVFIFFLQVPKDSPNELITNLTGEDSIVGLEAVVAKDKDSAAKNKLDETSDIE